MSLTEIRLEAVLCRGCIGVPVRHRNDTGLGTKQDLV